jgi:hypothetical protein
VEGMEYLLTLYKSGAQVRVHVCVRVCASIDPLCSPRIRHEQHIDVRPGFGDQEASGVAVGLIRDVAASGDAKDKVCT